MDVVNDGLFGGRDEGQRDGGAKLVGFEGI